MNNIGTEPLTWRVCLARTQPKRLAAVTACLVTAGVAGWLLLGPFTAIAAVIVLVISLAEFLAPVSFTITPEYVQARTLVGSQRMLWSEVCSCFYSGIALRVSSVNRSSPLFAFRGITVYFNKNSEQVLELVSSIRGQA